MSLEDAMEVSFLPTRLCTSDADACNLLSVKDLSSPGDLNKKRKLLEYELGNSQLQWPKHKLRDRCSISQQVSSLQETTEKELKMVIEKQNEGGLVSDELEVESQHGSNSFGGGSDENMPFEVTSNKEQLSKNYGNFSENMKNDMEENDEEHTEDLMLYSNDVPPFLLSSGRWSTGKDARMGMEKPTIDQEFEQYFSALML